MAIPFFLFFLFVKVTLLLTFLKEFSKDRHFKKGARQPQTAAVAGGAEKGGKKPQPSPGQQGPKERGRDFFVLWLYFSFMTFVTVKASV